MPLEGHEGSVVSAQFSVDGTRIVTASWDDTARLWREASDGSWSAVTLKGHRDWVNYAQFSADGTRIVTASRDGTARLWREASDGGWSAVTLGGTRDGFPQLTSTSPPFSETATARTFAPLDNAVSDLNRDLNKGSDSAASGSSE